MDFLMELITIDLDRTTRYSLAEVAHILGEEDLDKLEYFCLRYHLGKELDNGTFTFTKGRKNADDDISTLEFYLEHPDVEKEVIDFIKENQPTTINTIKTKLSLSREKVWKVVDEVTLTDINLMERQIGKKDYLLYGEKGVEIMVENGIEE